MAEETTFRGITADAVTNAAAALTRHLSGSGDWSKATPAMARAALEASGLPAEVERLRGVLSQASQDLADEGYSTWSRRLYDEVTSACPGAELPAR